MENEIRKSEAIKCRGGRSGVKIHLSTLGSTVTDCGIWLRHDTRHYRVGDGTPVNCEKCNPDQVPVQIAPRPPELGPGTYAQFVR